MTREAGRSVVRFSIFAVDLALHCIALLSDGRVLASGGFENCYHSCVIQDTAELYDERTGQWDWAPGTMAAPRSAGHILVALPDGTALVAGGYSGSQYLALAEIFCPP